MLNRRRFLASSLATASMAAMPIAALSQQPAMRQRLIPGTDESLPVVGLGNSVVFQEGNLERSRQLIDILREFGGSYVDISAASRDVVGGLAASGGFEDELFLGTYIEEQDDRADRDDALLQRRVQDKSALDLVLTRNIDDYAARADSFRRLRDDGITRYIGVARHQQRYHGRMIELIEQGAVDFVQVNYSILEPEAEERLLPAAMEHGVAILVNRPFINGDYFRIVRDRELPGWAAEIGCDTWAKVSLKFILSHPAVNCVLTETANPRHARDNLGAGSGPLPDDDLRRRMRETVLSFV